MIDGILGGEAVYFSQLLDLLLDGLRTKIPNQLVQRVLLLSLCDTQEVGDLLDVRFAVKPDHVCHSHADLAQFRLVRLRSLPQFVAIALGLLPAPLLNLALSRDPVDSGLKLGTPGGRLELFVLLVVLAGLRSLCGRLLGLCGRLGLLRLA